MGAHLGDALDLTRAVLVPIVGTVDQGEQIRQILVSLFHAWPLWLALAAIGLGKLGVWLWRERRLARSGIGDVDRMDGRSFEQYLRTLFVRLGYKVEVTRYQGDFGADLVVTKDGKKTAVQAKRYPKNVGLKAVQEAVAAKGFYDAESAMVVTNSYFTAQAKDLARKNSVALWDRDKLVTVLLRKDVSDAPDAASSPGAPTAVRVEAQARCAECSAPVSEKVRAYCADNSERFGGATLCYQHQRGFRRVAPSAS